MTDGRRRTGDRHDPVARRLYRREYMRKQRGSGLQSSLPFVGVDGEGGGEQGDKHPGYHAYFLLRAGGTTILPREGNVRLTTGQCLETLSQLDPACIYVGYFFDYDVTKILEDLPIEKLTRLMDRSLRVRKDGRGIFPVDFGPYELDYIPRKEFKVRKGGGPWIVINDVGPFFQCRFVEALASWGIGTDAEREIIAAGKDMRGNFDLIDIETIDRYNAMEIKLLQELMEKFRSACTDVGLAPSKWQGPGQLAKALMAKHSVPKSKDVPLLSSGEYDDLLTFGRHAYYGGRPELMAIGPVNRPVYQWDINSAYPAGMLSVPCLMHGGWEFEEYEKGMDAAKIKADAAIVYGTFARKKLKANERPAMWNGLPFRSPDGSICYPGTGTGWYWSFEIASAKHQSFRAKSAWVYNRTCDCQPLSFVRPVYEQRLALGKDGAGMVLKLALNSLYGICVQSIGRPEYANSIWGSYLTAFCRTICQEFLHSSEACAGGICGHDVLMIATDSLATITDRQDLTPSKELGGWSVETHPLGMFLIQPGLYFGSSGKRAKTRGVPLAVITEKEGEFRAAFDKMVQSKRLEDGDVEVPQRMFVGIRYAIHRRNLKLMGQWISFGDTEEGEAKDGKPRKNGKTIRFDWTTKRVAFPVAEPNAFHSYLETYPKLGTADDCTTPYSKDIGGLLQREELRLMMADQPEWAPMIEPGELA